MRECVRERQRESKRWHQHARLHQPTPLHHMALIARLGIFFVALGTSSFNSVMSFLFNKRKARR